MGTLSFKAAGEWEAPALAEAAALHSAGRLGEAERIYREVLRANGHNAAALHGLGLVAQQVGDLPDAERLLRAAVAADMRADVYRTNLGNVLQMQGRPGDAVGEYERALMLRPDSAAALSNLGAALLALGRAAEAEERLRRAAVLRPESAQVLDNLGNALQATGQLEEAVGCHERALARMPRNAEFYGNLGLALAGLGRWEAAQAAFETGLALEPGNARIQLARAQLQLLLGNFADGLRNYEWRKRVHRERKLAGREWRGERLAAGETLLLYAEQGLGDTVQCLRYLPWLRGRMEAGAELLLEVQEQVRRLAGELGERVVAAGEALPEFGWHCSLMSLPLILRETLAGEGWIPAEVPYLRVPEVALWKMREVAPSPGMTSRERPALHVGLVWAGNRAHVRDRFRSIPFPSLEPLLGVEGAEFHSLQLGEAKSAGDWAIDQAIEQASDLADTAALIERLDLVVGVDTAIVHLAGALGKAVWTLLPFWPDWRWGVGTEDCPWYPTMRLFRQGQPGDWAGVVEAVQLALAKEVGNHARCDTQSL